MAAIVRPGAVTSGAYSSGAMVIRDADPHRDAAACAAIYAPFVRDTAVSFEENPPDAEAMRERIAPRKSRIPGWWPRSTAPWPDTPTPPRIACAAAYRWAADVRMYIGERHRGRGRAPALRRSCCDLLRRQGFTSPAPASPCPTRPASLCTRRSGSRRSGSIARSASSSAPGTTSAGGSGGSPTRHDCPHRRPGTPAAPQRQRGSRGPGGIRSVGQPAQLGDRGF